MFSKIDIAVQKYLLTNDAELYTNPTLNCNIVDNITIPIPMTKIYSYLKKKEVQLITKCSDKQFIKLNQWLMQQLPYMQLNIYNKLFNHMIERRDKFCAFSCYGFCINKKFNKCETLEISHGIDEIYVFTNKDVYETILLSSLNKLILED
jgi:hypothetical protein